MRYNRQERVGISRVQQIVTEDLKWIFREQPLVDVGIDALIEKADDDNPKGKFIGAQIKSGDSHVHKSSKFYTFYVSNVHKEYWMQVSIPMILLLYLPSKKHIVWESITKETLLKTNTKWKIEIPKDKILGENSIEDLDLLVVEKGYSPILAGFLKVDDLNETIYDHIENIRLIKDSTSSINRIANEILELRQRVKEYTSKFTSYGKYGYTDSDPEVLSSINGFSKAMQIASRRLESEILIFSEIFAAGFYSFYTIIVINYSLNDDVTGREEALKALKTIPPSAEEAIQGFKSMNKAVKKLPTKYPRLAIARKKLIETTNLLIDEVSEASEMTQSFILQIAKQSNNR